MDWLIGIGTCRPPLTLLAQSPPALSTSALSPPDESHFISLLSERDVGAALAVKNLDCYTLVQAMLSEKFGIDMVHYATWVILPSFSEGVKTIP